MSNATENENKCPVMHGAMTVSYTHLTLPTTEAV